MFLNTGIESQQSLYYGNYGNQLLLVIVLREFKLIITMYHVFITRLKIVLLFVFLRKKERKQL